MESSFTTTDFIERLDIPRERLRDWLSRGFIKPSIPSPGQGKAAEFTLEDAYKIHAFRVMVEGGLSRYVAAEFISAIEEEKDSPPTEVIVFRRSPDGVAALRVAAGGDWVLDLQQGFPGITKAHPGVVSLVLRKTGKTWSDIYVMNFRLIREHVDSRLSGG